jgi:hypothetical protein
MANRYMNIEKDEEEMPMQQHPIPKTRKKDITFFFIDKDPDTGRRCAIPIATPDITPTFEKAPKIGRIRTENMYLVELMDSYGQINTFNVCSSSPTKVRAMMEDFLNKPNVEIVRQSTICEGH